MMRLSFSLCLMVMTALLAVPVAHAADDADKVAEAHAVETHARKSFKARDFETAAKAFAQAFRLVPKAATKYNEALAWIGAKRPAPAADAYEAALNLGTLDPKREQASRLRLGKLKTELGRLEITAPDGALVSVGHARNRSTPARIHLEPGKHVVTVQGADGWSDEQVIVVAASKVHQLMFSKHDAALPKAKPDASKRSAAMRIAGWTTLALGGAALIGMGVTGGLTQSKVSDYDAGGNVDGGLRDDAVSLKTTTNVLLGVGATLAAAGSVLLIVDASSDETKVSAGVGLLNATLRIDW